VQTGFDVFSSESSANSLHGLFAEVNFDSFKLGKTHEARNTVLCSIITEIAPVLSETSSDHDLLGDAYEYLISQFAEASGRSSGEFYTPHQVSTIMARIVILDGNDPSVGKRQSMNGLLDFACGSASLLINVRRQFSPNRIGMIYGQELNRATYNLARMNMLIHGIRDSEFQIHNGDSLLNDWDIFNEKNPGERIACDAIVANPPFSCRWDPEDILGEDVRFKDYGLAPTSTADYAFLLHGFRFLSDEGTMALVFPHGILFRGGIEETIRTKLLTDGSIDTIIGLPAKLFSSTGVAVCILVLTKRTSHDNVLFIDASECYEKGRRKNNLLPEHIDRIVDTYQFRREVEKYSRRVSMEEIRKNGFNRSIQRYVDTTDEEEVVDLSAVNRSLVDIEATVQRATARHNQFLKELGLPELP
jgi:type I restriction enzyme M protein